MAAAFNELPLNASRLPSGDQTGFEWSADASVTCEPIPRSRFTTQRLVKWSCSPARSAASREPSRVRTGLRYPSEPGTSAIRSPLKVNHASRRLSVEPTIAAAAPLSATVNTQE
jgi:hypothetical protein